jgi:hypothetical protein
MKSLQALFTLCLIGIICVFSFSPVESAAGSPPEEHYKNFYSDGWFGTYALREFDKIAPVPGVNWFVEDAQDWLARAQRDGWEVRHKPSEAISGSIILGYHEGLVWVGIAREVTDKGLVFETVMGGDGKPARYWMKFADLAAAIHFQGCILPQRIPGAKTVSPMADFKTARGFSGAAWPAQEFDNTAPKPGFNWQGAEKDWPDQAQRQGWLVDKKTTAVKKGSLLVLYNPEAQKYKIAFARDVIDSTLIFEFVDPPFSRVITARLKLDQLMEPSAFGGFVLNAVILPERKRK